MDAGGTTAIEGGSCTWLPTMVPGEVAVGLFAFEPPGVDEFEPLGAAVFTAPAIPLRIFAREFVPLGLVAPVFEAVVF